MVGEWGSNYTAAQMKQFEALARQVSPGERHPIEGQWAVLIVEARAKRQSCFQGLARSICWGLEATTNRAFQPMLLRQ